MRSLEINLKYLSHDWHVQPVVKDPIAFSALGGALGERRLKLYAAIACPRNFLAISLGSFPQNTQPHNLFGTRKVPHRRVRLVEDYFARRFDLLAERAILLTLSRFAAIYRASGKSHSFKLKIV